MAVLAQQREVLAAAGLAATAWLAVRRDRRLAFPAISTATLLAADAWFDVCTAPAGSSLVWALAEMAVEQAEAAACVALAVTISWRPRSATALDTAACGAHS